MVDGALVTVEKIKTVAADGTVQVAEQIKKSSENTFDGLWKELQTEADSGMLAPSMICTPPSRIRTGWASASGWRAPSTAV